jgi:hypothetical protein
MKRPIESDYTSQVAYTRALEAYCDSLAQPTQEPVEEWQGQSNIESPHNACQHRSYCKQLKENP